MTAIANPSGIRSRFVNDINGLTMRVLEAGFTPLLQEEYPTIASASISTS
jgi:hypothetical protein